MLFAAAFAVVCLLVSPTAPKPLISEVFQKVSKELQPVSSALSQLYSLPGIFTGNAERSVKVVHYSGGNWADILSGLGFLGDGILSAGGVTKGNGVTKLSQSYQVGDSIQIGGAVIHVDNSKNSSGSSAYVVIGRNVSSNFSTHSGKADGIIIDNDNLDENGFFKGSWGYTPLEEDSIQSYTGRASVKIMTADGEKQEVIIPVVRPAIPAVVGGESGNTTEVQSLTLLNILQSNLINYFSFLLQASPITTNPKMIATIEELHKRLLLGQINAKGLLPQLKKLISLPLQEQLQNVLKSFVPVVEPDFGLQIQHLYNYLQEPTVVGFLFTQQIPTLTGGIDKRWVLPSFVGHPFYNTTDTSSFVNYDLRQFLQQNKESSDREYVKYKVYLVMTTIPLPMDIKAAVQFRNLASVLYAMKDSVWEMIIQRLSNMPVPSAYSGLKDFLRLVVWTPGVPNEVNAIIENILGALPNERVSPTGAVHFSTNITLPPQPENFRSHLTELPYNPQSIYPLKLQQGSQTQQAIQNQIPSHYQSLQFNYDAHENNYPHTTENKPITKHEPQQHPQYSAQQTEYLPESQHELLQSQYPSHQNYYQYASQNKPTKQYQLQQELQYSAHQAEYQQPLTDQQQSHYQSPQTQYSPNQRESQYKTQKQPPAQYQVQYPQYSPEHQDEPQYTPQIEPQPQSQYPLQYQPQYPQQPAFQPKPQPQLQWSPKIKLQPEYTHEKQSDAYQTQYKLSQTESKHQAQYQPKIVTSRPQVQHEPQFPLQYTPQQQESESQHKTQYSPLNLAQPEHEHKPQYQKGQEKEQKQQFEYYQPQPQYTPYDQPRLPYKLQYLPERPEAQYQSETQDQAQNQHLHSPQNQPQLINPFQNLYPPHSEPHIQYTLQHPQPQYATKPHGLQATPDSAEVTQIKTILPVGESLDTPSESDLQNPSELLPVCSGYEGCSYIDKIRYLFREPSIIKFIQSLDINVSRYSNKTSLLCYIFQQMLSQILLQAKELIAIQQYSDYLTSTLKPWTTATPKPSSALIDITYILPTCTNTSLYCLTLKRIGTMLLQQDIYNFLQENVLSFPNYPTKEAYLQSILQKLMSRNLVSVKDMGFVELFLQYMKEHSNILVSGDALSEILKHIIQPSDEQEKKLFEIVSNWLSKANLAEVSGDYKIDLFATAEQILKVILRFALSHLQYTYNKELQQGLPYFISKASPSSTTTNAEDSVEDLGIQIMGETDVVTEATWTPVYIKESLT